MVGRVGLGDIRERQESDAWKQGQIFGQYLFRHRDARPGQERTEKDKDGAGNPRMEAEEFGKAQKQILRSWQNRLKKITVDYLPTPHAHGFHKEYR